MKVEWPAKYYKAILLMLIVAYAVNMRLDLQQPKPAYPENQPNSVWAQPASLKEKFPVLIQDNIWSLNYSKIEILLWESSYTTSSRLHVNSNTVDLLQKVSAYLPERLNDKELERLSFLVKTSLPDDSGTLMAALIKQYYSYQNEHLSALTEINNAKGEKQLLLLKKVKISNERLQQKYFGEKMADNLFSKKNMLFNYLIDRRIVQVDKRLTKEQKKKQLSALKTQYKNKFSG